MENTRKSIGLMVASGVGVALVISGIALRAHQVQVAQAAIAATQTASITDTPTPSATPTDIPTPTSTLTPSSTPTGTLVPTPTSTATSTPSPSPTPLPIEGTYPTPLTPPSTAIPTAMNPIPVPDGVVNIMLLGSDTPIGEPNYRTDTIIIVSINRNEGTVSTLSLLRDLYVYVPGWMMNRLNTAAAYGGPDLLRETLLYNFGIQVDYYARVDFEGFKQIIDIIGGVDIAVDCAMEEWRLISPELDVNDPDNWELFRLDVGVHHMDGDLALWYGRSRGVTSNDYDRVRRQQQILRAIWAQSRDLGMIPRAPELWTQYSNVVETDMRLSDVLQLAPIAANLDTSRIRSYVITGNMVTSWTHPVTGASVLIPNPGVMEQVITQAMQPPAANYAAQQTALVEVRNGTDIERLDEVAAERLAWEGLLTTPTGATTERLPQTLIYDFTGRVKASQLETLQRVLRVPDANVIIQLDPTRTADYLVILGEDYRSCTSYDASLLAPASTPSPTLEP